MSKSSRHAAIATAGLLLAIAFAAVGAANADAAHYKAVFCAGSSLSPPYATTTNTASPQNPGGIFEFHAWCDGRGGDPPGEDAFMRIAENQPSGLAGYGAYGNFVIDSPAHVHFRTGGAYTRQFNSFHEGWRARFWVASASSTAQLMTQGQGLTNSNGHWASTGDFRPHLWPIGHYWDFNRFVYEMQCVRAAGCERGNYNATDINGFVFILSDDVNSHAEFTDTGSALWQGQWVRGTHNAHFQVSDLGSGLRHERLRIDNAQRWNWDHWAECNVASSHMNGEFARSFQPCPTGGPWGRSVPIYTDTLADGEHSVQICTQDYAQYRGLDGTGGESCAARTIRTDNSAPGAPSGLSVTSANPNRYLDRFGAVFSLPPNTGSPITKAHYQVLNARGEVVKPTTTISATNPTTLSGFQGPKAPGTYHVRLWLEDQVGHTGTAATAPIPRDTTPPSAPQGLRVAGPGGRWVENVDLRWRNQVDSGSPIVAASYRMLNSAGKVVIPARAATGTNIEAIDGLPTPPSRSEYSAEVWLTDEEGNVGAPAAVPLPLDTTPPAAPQSLTVAAPSSSRGAEGFDLRWRNLHDSGSAIAAAHYQVLSAGGEVIVPATSVAGRGIEGIADLRAAYGRGNTILRLWLSDEEGNVGAPVSAQLSYSCARSEVGGGVSLTGGLGASGKSGDVLQQGQGVDLTGTLLAPGGASVANASLCVFSRVETDSARTFLGLAHTDAEGRYSFALPAGPSRELTVVYRGDHREVSSTARVWTRVKPTFTVRRSVVRNKGLARFKVQIPGPDNGDVVVVFQVQRGKGWLAFRRVKTGADGSAEAVYRFTRTDRATLYKMRAQVRTQSGYAYLAGSSKVLRLVVLPADPGGRPRKAG